MDNKTETLLGMNTKPRKFDPDKYAWIPECLQRFVSWDDYILYSFSEGYSLVHPDYFVPGLKVYDAMKSVLPDIYFYKNAYHGHFAVLPGGYARHAKDFGYPLFFKNPNTLH